MIICRGQNRNIQHFEYKVDTSSIECQGAFTLVEKEDKFEIWSLGVPPKYRCKGYATQMLREFISEFDFTKILALYVLKPNTIAIHLYQNLGFKIVGDYKYDCCAYEMQLNH
jgi:ribosomal protein S18 acetylase RimI-like enzyme